MSPDLTEGGKSLAYSLEGRKLHPTAKGRSKELSNPKLLLCRFIPEKERMELLCSLHEEHKEESKS